MNNAIKATWMNGQIVPAEPVDWPEGCSLKVEPVGVKGQGKIGLTEDEWKDDPESIAEWIAWVDTIEPIERTDEERAEWDRYLEEHRRFNIDAVRRQMGLGGDS